jgi:predicted CXXCH cytochrome family protein
MLKLLVCRSSVLLLVLLCATAAAATPQHTPDEKDSSRRYAGSEACRVCHDELYTPLQETAHAQLFKKGPGPDEGCETCHGPGQGHVDSNGDRGKILTYTDMSKEAVREHCGRCHVVSGDKPHVAKGVGCLSCHSIHHFQEKKALLVLPANRLCQKCHAN